MSQMNPKVHTIAVIGLGLIGGSLAKAAKQTGFAAHTIGYSLNFSEVKLGERGFKSRWKHFFANFCFK